ncbi:hypothetical protein H4R33_004245 [Dimargaris cristalligena]|nr:hypothetical protein H4R33_004245 [Dimargaris cristalligena]
MGVAACGKSHIGAQLFELLNQDNRYLADFLEGDDYHTDEMIDQMRHGVGLTDAQRWPWLYRIREACIERLQELRIDSDDGPSPLPPSASPPPSRLVLILACSALKRSYRDFLRTLHQPNLFRYLYFIYLDCSPQMLYTRIKRRGHHFAGTPLLQSQLNTLEPPNPEQEPDVLVMDSDQPASKSTAQAFTFLRGLP